MSSPSEALAKMKGAPIRCVETDYRPVAVVTFYPWQAKEWALPWSRLDALSIYDEEESERVELFFPHHHIIMIGDNLRDFLEDIRTFQVLCATCRHPTAPPLRRVKRSSRNWKCERWLIRRTVLRWAFPSD